MKKINIASTIKIYWKVWRGANKVSENFDSLNANLKVFLVGSGNTYVTEHSINKEIDPGYDVIEIAVSSNMLEAGVYDLKAIWKKNDGRDFVASRRSGVFGISLDGEVKEEEIRLVSYVESFGSDGLSAYETAVMRNLNNGISSEVKWVGNEAKRIADEEARDEAEKAREEAEMAREGAEAKRVNTFETNEETRQTTFETNEANRGATFTSNETNRENAYLSSEQDREVRFATAEENRNKGEAIRQAAFEGGENVRATTFTRNEESRQRRFEDEVEQRAEAFNAYESSRQRAFEQAERDRGVLFRSKEDAREADELKRDQAEDIRNAQESVRQQAEQIRIDTFDENERGRIATFNANEAARIAAESERNQNEAQREANEEIRQASYQDKLPVSAVVQETGDRADLVMSQKVVSKALKYELTSSLRNGGAGNGSNGYKVRTCGLDVRGKSEIILTTNKPTDNSYYMYECLFVSNADAIGQFFANNENSKGYTIIRHAEGINAGLIVDVPSGASAVVVALYEVPIGGKEGDIVLRMSNFDGYSIGYSFNLIEQQLEKQIQELSFGQETLLGKGSLCAIANGTCNNSGNAFAIRTNVYIPAKKGDSFKVRLEKVLAEGHYLKWWFGGSSSNDKFTDLGTLGVLTESCGIESEVDTYTITSDKTIGFHVAVFEFDEQGNSIPLRMTDIAIKGISVYSSNEPSIFSSVSDNRKEIDALTSAVQALRKDVDKTELTTSLRNGGAQNGSNGYKVRTCGLSVDGKKAIIPITEKPKEGDTYYIYELAFILEKEAVGKFFASNENYNNYTALKYYSNIAENEVVPVPVGASAVVIAVYEIPKDGEEGDIILRTSNFNNRYGIGYSYNIDVYVEVEENSYHRNIGKITALGAACRQRKESNTSKDFQALVITDSHEDNNAVKNAVDMTNGFHTIDCMIHCGDMMGDFLVSNGNATTFISEMSKCKKPWFNVIGNHEAGTYNVVGYVPTIAKMRSVFIQPMIDAGVLTDGEHVVDNCYYYHDFLDRKIRLIALNEYDGDLALDNEYWEATQYDTTHSVGQWGKSYNVGDVIRMSFYDEHSFRCVKAATFGSSIYAPTGQEPRYKAQPGSRMISEAQANWFVNALASTPSEYGVIIALHNPFSDNAKTLPNKVFCENVEKVGVGDAQNSMDVDFIADAVDAFMRGAVYSEKVSFRGGASYRNTKSNGNKSYAYEIYKDFSVKNSGVKFLFYIGGHVHYDLIWQHQSYNQQYQVTPVCATTSYHQSPNSDIRRSNISESTDYDSITVVSADLSRKLRLVKLGVDTTIDMEKRDIEMIDLVI